MLAAVAGAATSWFALTEPSAPSEGLSPVAPFWALPDGLVYPVVSLNTAGLSVDGTEGAVREWIGVGGRNVDFHMGTERQGVALAIKALGRSAFFLTTKIAPPPTDINASAAADLVRHLVATELNVTALGSPNGVDLLLLKDSPSCPVMQAQWAAAEEVLAHGLTRALGVYNYCAADLECILATAKTRPEVNYLMRHPGMGSDATGIIEFSASHGIRTTAYGTLGEPVALPELLSDPTLHKIADAHGRTVEAVALRWNLQAGHGISNRPGADYNNNNNPPTASCTNNCSVAAHAMVDLFEWALTPAEVAEIDALRFAEPPQSPTYYAQGCPGTYSDVRALTPNSSSVCSRETPPTNLSSWC